VDSKCKKTLFSSRYEPNLEKWTKIADPLLPLEGYSLSSFGDELVLAGVHRKTEQTHVLAYNTTADAWREVSHSPVDFVVKERITHSLDSTAAPTW